MYTRLSMGAFLENPMFLFVDDAEPILPTIRSPEYDDTDRIVELADVGCDTEAVTFPVHFPYYRGGFDRRRGGAENLSTYRRIAKWRNETPSKFSRATAVLNDNEDRNENYVRGKVKRNDHNYDDLYIADYDSFAENSYDDFEFTKNDPAVVYKNDYYTRFANPRNVIGHSRKERLPRNTRHDYSRDLESPFTRGIPERQRANDDSSRWFMDSDERNLREIRDIDPRSNQRKRRTKAFSRTDERTDFNTRETEFDETRGTRRRERNAFSNTADPVVFSKNDFWDSVSLENEANCEELTYSNPTRTTDVIDSEREEKFKETRQQNSQEYIFLKAPTGSARHWISKSDAVTGKPKILQSNTSNANSPRVRSARTSTNDRISNARPTGKNSTRPRSAIGGKESGIDPPTIEKKEEVVREIRINANNRPYRQKFVDKLSNTCSDERVQSPRTSKHVATSNERIHLTNGNSNINSHSRNTENNKIDRIDVAVSRSTPEEKVTRNERTFALRMTALSRAEMAEREKRREFSSRLPVRTWKRRRTKEPAVPRLESDVANEDIGRKLLGVNVEATNSNNNANRIVDSEVHEEIAKDRFRNCATTDRSSDVKRSNRLGTGSFDVDKAKSAPSNWKNTKGVKGSNTTNGTDERQRRKRISVK